MTGRSFRQRPVDIHKQLDIVRDETLLDSAEGLPIKEIVQNHIVADVKKEPVRTISPSFELYACFTPVWRR